MGGVVTEIQRERIAQQWLEVVRRRRVREASPNGVERDNAGEPAFEGRL
jgi:hypothetical protein